MATASQSPAQRIAMHLYAIAKYDRKQAVKIAARLKNLPVHGKASAQIAAAAENYLAKTNG